ncbi:MAG: DMT family transporter [Candidatus Azobacteroides sp.]|nr:DMT family transporter [Candidatus Azobacteroides sp.]
MNKKTEGFLPHLLAILIVTIWGTTFVSTKVLLYNGLTAFEIYMYRFLLAYIAIWFIALKKLWSGNIKDELLLFAGGLAGGSVYYLSENIALLYSTASNVSLIVCANPLITLLIITLFYKSDRMKAYQITGSVIAFAGMVVVVLNGHFVFNISPLGDMLALVAAISWSVYSLILKNLSGRYPILFINRKVFFYGLISLLPVFIFRSFPVRLSLLNEPVIWGNLLYLGFVASMICYILWSWALKQLGTVRTSNYIYFIPLITMATAVIVIHETVNSIILLGAALILGGLYLSGKKELSIKNIRNR